jgi:hypothetical protein
MDLSKFKGYEFVPGIASVTIAKHGMGFSKKAISELGGVSHEPCKRYNLLNFC